MKLAFKIYSFSPWYTPIGVADRLIAWWTQSPYCHVETVFDCVPQAGRVSYCFSADPANGVRFKWIDLCDLKEWKLVDLDVTRTDEEKAYAYAKTLVGRRYNELGIVRFMVGPVHDPTNEDFCSQVCLLVQEFLGKWKGIPTDRVDPGFLYDLVTS